MPVWLTFTALRGLLARELKWLGSLNGYELACIGLALLLVVDHVGLLLAHRHSAKVETQLAASAQALSVSRGNEVALRAAIVRQNAAVQAISDKSTRQQQAAAKASQAAQERAREAEDIAGRIEQSARSAPAQRAPAGTCEPSKVLQEQWK